MPARRKPKVLSRDAALATLHSLASDLWWSWSEVAQRPFAALDPTLWRSTRRSPRALLAQVDPARLEARLGEVDFRTMVQVAGQAQQAYAEARTWYQRTSKKQDEGLRVAFLCSEFALHESLGHTPTALGVQAGDFIKSASDLGLPLVGVGLLFQQGTTCQELRGDGTQRAIAQSADCAALPLVDTGAIVACMLGERQVRVKVWRQQVGRVSLYLLDANLPDNAPEDRALTARPNPDDAELRLGQQALLGIAGVRALRVLNEPISVFHLNGSEVAFAQLERLAQAVESGVALIDAEAAVKESSVYTLHSTEPTECELFDLDDVQSLLSDTIKRASLAETDLRRLGLERPSAKRDPFCATVLALRLSRTANGISELHGRASRARWAAAFGVEDPEHTPITHVAAGAHTDSWMDPAAKVFWRKHAGIRLEKLDPDKELWGSAERADRGAFWELRNNLRTRLIQFTRDRLAAQAESRGESATAILEQSTRLDPGALTIGMSLPIAAHERPALLFSDRERLAKLLASAKAPVQIILAGQADPADKDGRELVQKLHRLAHDKRFEGRVVFLEQQDLETERQLSAGADLWLSTPRRTQAAAHTSGMLSPLHGGIHCSTLNSWWDQGYDGTNGWAISEWDEPLGSQRQQDQADAASLYQLLENEIVPEFHATNRQGQPLKWIKRALRSAATVSDYFNGARHVGECAEWLYRPSQAST